MNDGESNLNQTAVVLFSGGQDSTTCLFWAKRRFSRVVALGFDYGQRHRVELEQAALIARNADVKFHLRNLAGLFGDSALTDPSRSTAERHRSNDELPATFVPARNLVFLSIAGAFAYSIDCFDLVTGVCQTDYSGYPDCRREFVDSMERTLSLATAPSRFRIHTPLMDLDKADTFKLAEDLGILSIVLNDTHTDYHGDRSTKHPWGNGNLDNDAGRLRAKGWEEYLRRRGLEAKFSDRPDRLTEEMRS
jgi:7-cyano-7-deazaguanine synthase